MKALWLTVIAVVLSFACAQTARGEPGVVCLDAPNAVPLPKLACKGDPPDTLDEALGAAGVDRCSLTIDPFAVERSGYARRTIHDPERALDLIPLWIEPLRLPGYAGDLARTIDAAMDGAGPVSSVLFTLAARRGRVPFVPCADLRAFEPARDDATPLATALLLFESRRGKALDAAKARAMAAPVPRPLQEKLARVIGALDLAAREVNRTLGPTAEERMMLSTAAIALVLGDESPFEDSEGARAVLDRVDLGKIAAAAQIVAKVIEGARFDEIPPASFPPFEIETSEGSIVVRDASPDRYAEGSIAERALLLFDLGGDDVYRVPFGATNGDRPIAVAIDARGKDDYGYEIAGEPDRAGRALLPSDRRGRSPAGPTRSRIARQGAGVGGIGLAFDLGAEGDTYRSLALSQGFAAMGVGALYDAGGDDLFEAEIGAQGAAIYGVAALVDRAGDDRRRAITFAQGFAGPRAVAILADAAGSDTYTCDPGDAATGQKPLYPAPFVEANSSMAQGASLGHRPLVRADLGRRRIAIAIAALLYGVGALLALLATWRERRGASIDRLRLLAVASMIAGALAHGAAFWLHRTADRAFPMTAGLAGAAAIAGALAVAIAAKRRPLLLLTPVIVGALGVGRTYFAGRPASFSGGIGALYDRAGNDHYEAGVYAQGAANFFGAGIFIDGGGDDTFDAVAYGQGAAAHASLGYFEDVAGNDAYNQARKPAIKSLGFGHDFGAGVHVDRGGDDKVKGPSFSIGAGNIGGVGVYVNLGGDDSYEALAPPAIGDADDRADPKQAPTIGIFVDAGGKDRYWLNGKEIARDQTSWGALGKSSIGPRSGGVDKADGKVIFPP